MNQQSQPNQQLAAKPGAAGLALDLNTMLQLFMDDPENKSDLAYSAVICNCQQVPQAIRGDLPSVFYQIQYARQLGIPRTMAMSLLFQTPEGKIGAEGKAILGVLLTKGFKIKWSPLDSKFATCSITRPGDNEPTERSFNWTDAQNTFYWNRKNQKMEPLSSKFNYQSYPQDMLQWRSFMRCARACAADVIAGLLLREELEEIAEPPEDTRHPAAETPAEPEGVGRKPKQSAPADAPVQTSEPESSTTTATSDEPTTPTASDSAPPAEQVSEPAKPDSIPSISRSPLVLLTEQIINMEPPLQYSPDAAKKRFSAFCRSWLDCPDLRGKSAELMVPMTFIQQALRAGLKSTVLLEKPDAAGAASRKFSEHAAAMGWAADTVTMAFKALQYIDCGIGQFLDLYIDNLGAKDFGDVDAFALFECASRCREAYLITGTKAIPDSLMKALGLSFAQVWDRVKKKPDNELEAAMKGLVVRSEAVSRNDPFDLFPEEEGQ